MAAFGKKLFEQLKSKEFRQYLMRYKILYYLIIVGKYLIRLHVILAHISGVQLQIGVFQ